MFVRFVKAKSKSPYFNILTANILKSNTICNEYLMLYIKDYLNLYDIK